MKCSVDGCENEAKQKYGGDNQPYCGKHLHMMYRHGKIIEHHRRSPLDYYIENETVHIKLYDNYGEYVGETLIDLDDLERVKEFRCALNTDSYATINNRDYRFLHKFIMDIKGKEFVVDHINGNKLDNRKQNLRIITNQQNIMNTHNDGRGNNSRKGVSVRKYKSGKIKWRAYIMIDKKQISLGVYDTEEEAIQARIAGEIKYFGEYRRTEESDSHEE